jgi:2-hydroxychromene-2-carboxylate isomerase
MTAVDFYFDPACPWTWLTARWLVDVAPQRGLDVTWRPLSLLVLQGGEPPEEFASMVVAASHAHRVVAALQDAGRNDLVGALYEEIGERTFQVGTTLTDDIVAAAVEAAGAGAFAHALGDASWDAAVEASTKQAMDLAGPDVGSPVLAMGEPRVGWFGPIVSPGPRGEDAAALYDAVVAIASAPGFFELKRGRSDPPSLPAPEAG